ncbi:MAG TPA: polysaccharide deacetylase family protein [Casimicrobiaceae bacterium]
MRAQRIVLTWHSHNVGGNDYATNDHVALAADLATLAAAGVRIVPLEHVAAAHRDRHWPLDGSVEVTITFDDGPRFDVADFEHREWGAQRAFARVLRDAAPLFGARPGGLPATSFVIASPDARAAMERAPECGLGDLQGWLGDDWWTDAAALGIAIGNHSWDHLHPALREVAQRDGIRGDFTAIADYGDADRQVRRASEFILGRLQISAELPFAYPYGHVAPYLRDVYFPRHRAEHRCYAAFSTAGRAIDPDDSIWALPRFVCGWHWQDADGLRALIAAKT